MLKGVVEYQHLLRSGESLPRGSDAIGILQMRHVGKLVRDSRYSSFGWPTFGTIAAADERDFAAPLAEPLRQPNHIGVLPVPPTVRLPTLMTGAQHGSAGHGHDQNGGFFGDDRGVDRFSTRRQASQGIREQTVRLAAHYATQASTAAHSTSQSNDDQSRLPCTMRMIPIVSAWGRKKMAYSPALNTEWLPNFGTARQTLGYPTAFRNALAAWRLFDQLR